MPRPRPKGGFTVAPKEQSNEGPQDEFVVKLVVADKGPFGFVCKDVGQPVSWLLGTVQSFIDRMKGIFKLVSDLTTGSHLRIEASTYDVYSQGVWVHTDHESRRRTSASGLVSFLAVRKADHMKVLAYL